MPSKSWTKVAGKTKDSGTLEEAVKLMTSRAKDLSSVDIERLQSLLFEYGGVISLGNDDLGCTDVVKHRIDTGDVAPIRQRARKLPFNQRGEMQHLCWTNAVQEHH